MKEKPIVLTLLLLCRTASSSIHFRSSHQRCSVKKGVLRNFAKLTGKHLCQSLSFNKVAGARLWHRCFPVNFVKFLRTPRLGDCFLSTCVFVKKLRNCFRLLQLCHCDGLSDACKSNVFKIFKKRFLLMQMSHCTSIFAQNSLNIYQEIYIIDVLEFCIIIRFCGKLVS